MQRYKGLNYWKLSLASSVSLLIPILPAYAIELPITINNGDNIVYTNENINITTSGTTSPITVKGGSLHITDSDVSLSTTAGATPALKVEASGGLSARTITITGRDDQKVNFSTSGNSSNVVSVSGSNNNVLLDHAVIHATGTSSRGVSSSSGANILNIQNSSVNANGVGIWAHSNSGRSDVSIFNTDVISTSSFGMYFLNANVIADSFNITTGSADAPASNAYGINANWNTKLKLTDGQITTYGSNSHGIFLVGNYNNFNNDSVNADNVTIRTYGERANGYEIQKRKAIIHNSSIHTSGLNAYGIAVGTGGSGTVGGVAEVSETTIVTEGRGAAGILADIYSTINASNTNIITSGASAVGLRSHSSGRVNLANNSTISTSGAAAHGAYVTNGSQITIDSSSIQTTGANASGVLFAGSNTPTNVTPIAKHKNSAVITNSTITTTNGNALSVRGGAENKFTITGSDISASQQGGLLLSGEVYTVTSGSVSIPMNVGDIILNADSSRLKGDTLVNSGTLSYTLANNSIWTGAALTGVNDNVINSLTIDGTSAWNVTDTSTVKTLENTGAIAFTKPTGGYRTLTVTDNYSSSDGIFTLYSKLGDDTSLTDKLIFEADVSGTNQLQVINNGGIGAQTALGIKVIEIGGASDASFTLIGDYEHEGEQAVVAGAYAYKLYEGHAGAPNDNNWYLRSQLVPVDPGEPVSPEDPGEPVNPVDPEPPLYNAGAPLYEAYPQLLLGMNSLPTLQQRAGNRYWSNVGNLVLSQGADAAAPFAPAEEAGVFIGQNGVWGRIEGSHTKIKPRASTASSDYNDDIFKIQAGLDGMLHEAENGKLIGGLTVHYTHGKANISSPHGNGDIKADGYGFGGTLTWYGENGFYLDNQAQFTWYNSDLNSSTAQKILYDGNNGFGYALSMEAGKRFTINNNWSVTPQAQLIYSNVRFDSFTDAYGAMVSKEKADSLQGRLGISADYQSAWMNDQGMINRSTVYGIANFYNEFLDGTKVGVSGVSFINKRDRLWAGIGFGGSYNWNNDKYSIFGEGSINTSLNNFGDSYNYKGTVGLRIKW